MILPRADLGSCEIGGYEVKNYYVVGFEEGYQVMVMHRILEQDLISDNLDRVFQPTANPYDICYRSQNQNFKSLEDKSIFSIYIQASDQNNSQYPQGSVTICDKIFTPYTKLNKKNLRQNLQNYCSIFGFNNQTNTKAEENGKYVGDLHARGYNKMIELSKNGFDLQNFGFSKNRYLFKIDDEVLPQDLEVVGFGDFGIVAYDVVETYKADGSRKLCSKSIALLKCDNDWIELPDDRQLDFEKAFYNQIIKTIKAAMIVQADAEIVAPEDAVNTQNIIEASEVESEDEALILMATVSRYDLTNFPELELFQRPSNSLSECEVEQIVNIVEYVR